MRLEGPSQVSLFEYGDGTFVVESYLDHPAAVRVVGPFAHLVNLTSGASSGGEAMPVAAGRLARPPGAGAAPVSARASHRAA